MKCRHGIDALACGRCGPDSADVYRLEDGGVSLMVECTDTGRELTLVCTEDSRRMYFIARGDGERKAGVVAELEGVARLLHWLSGIAFSKEGLGVSEKPGDDS